jgi:glycine reductase
MKLDVASVEIQDVEFGRKAGLRNRVLVVERDEIRQLVLEDGHFSDVEVHLATPGKAVRIIHALDVVEPRWKVDGPGGVFPGFVTPPTAAGEGTTLRLARVAVVATGDPVPGEPTHFRERLIDLTGPGAELSPFGRTLNVVLHFRPNPVYFPPGCENVADVIDGGPEAADYNRAVLAATMRVAAHLARSAEGVHPDARETFELGPCDPGLPRVACVYQSSMTPFLYGIRVPLPMGALLHPNECFDGALIRWHRGFAGATYWEQNHAVLAQLCRRHGKELNFLGCILFAAITPSPADKERIAGAVAKLARLLRAEAALCLGVNGSNYAIDLMLAIQKCEQAGIRTTLIYNDVGDGADDPGFIFAVPEADAIVSAGSLTQRVTLPAMPTIIGGTRLVSPDIDPRGEITVPMRYVHGAADVHGHGRLSVRFE